MIEWQFADRDLVWNNIDISPIQPIRKQLPTWLKNLKGDIRNYFPAGFGLDHTARHCLGLSGLAHVGYTCPLPMDIKSFDYEPNPLGNQNFHPATLTGTKWANTLPGFEVSEHLHNYEWNLRLLEWPWRVKLPKNWRMLITGYMLDWSDDWYCFNGSPPAIVSKRRHRRQKYSQKIDKNFNYFNLEIVIAIKNGVTIPKGTCLFTAIPVPEANP